MESGPALTIWFSFGDVGGDWFNIAGEGQKRVISKQVSVLKNSFISDQVDE